MKVFAETGVPVLSSSSSSKDSNSNSSTITSHKSGDVNPDFVFSHHLFDGETFLESSTVEVSSSLKRKEDRPFTIDSSESEEESVVVLGTNDGPNKKIKLGWDVTQANKMAPEDHGTVQVATSSSRGPPSSLIVDQLCAFAHEEPVFVPRMTAPYRECHPSKHNCFRCVNHPPPGMNQELLSQALASVSRLEKQAALEMELLVKLANTIERLESRFLNMETTLTGLLVHEMSQNDILNALKTQIAEFSDTKQEANDTNAPINLWSSSEESSTASSNDALLLTRKSLQQW